MEFVVFGIRIIFLNVGQFIISLPIYACFFTFYATNLKKIPWYYASQKYYVGVDPLWAVSSPGAYSRTYTRTPEYSQNTPERCDADSLYETSSMFGTFGKDTGRKISEVKKIIVCEEQFLDKQYIIKAEYN